MVNLSECPVGSVTIGGRTLSICEKRGCKLENEFLQEAMTGGTDINGENNGRFWPVSNWSRLCERTGNFALPGQCVLGQHVLNLIKSITSEKLSSNPPELR